MALWNSPLARGVMAIRVTEAAPESSPKIVTLSGSPPNLPMLAFTQLRTMTWSRRPWLPPAVLSSVVRKPRGPSL